jgi:hypothetical protein
MTEFLGLGEMCAAVKPDNQSRLQRGKGLAGVKL